MFFAQSDLHQFLKLHSRRRTDTLQATVMMMSKHTESVELGLASLAGYAFLSQAFLSYVSLSPFGVARCIFGVRKSSHKELPQGSGQGCISWRINMRSEAFHSHTQISPYSLTPFVSLAELMVPLLHLEGGNRPLVVESEVQYAP